MLTADYTMKMLNINECMECKLPVIICGETGVGKTFLIEMISKMWNFSLKREIETKQYSLMRSISSSGKHYNFLRVSLCTQQNTPLPPPPTLL